MINEKIILASPVSPQFKGDFLVLEIPTELKVKSEKKN